MEKQNKPIMEDKNMTKMNENGKKMNLKAAVLAFAMIAVMMIGGISAYFTDGDTTTNTFTVGKISLDLQEPNWNPEDAEDITPNQTIKKDPQILNDGINDEFVFLEVIVPYENVVVANEDGTRKPAADTELYYYTVNSGWVEIATIKDAAAKTVTHLYVYGTADKCTALKKDATTPTLFDTVTFVNLVEDQGLEEATLDIVVNAYGIQTTDVNGGTVDPDMIWDVIDNQGPSLRK